MGEVLTALAVTLFAGMATGVGSAIAFFARRTNYRFLSVATGFSAGVMLYVSFTEILPKGQAAIIAGHDNSAGNWISLLAFFGGILLIGVIDNLTPSAENPHATPAENETAPLHDPAAPYADSAPASVRAAGAGTPRTVAEQRKLLRMGLFTALAIGIHNFPEGLATFLAVLESPKVGIAIAVAIALHNIPEGISVSVPIFYATGNRRKAFLYSLLSGMAEPIGAAVAYGALVLIVGGASSAIPPQAMGVLFAGVAGIMVYISLDELLPTSRAYGRGHDSIIGLVSGMAVMAISLLLMK
jgi:ZIP family zinc transporter